MIAEKHKKFIILGELFALSAVIWLINIQFPASYYGFWKVPVNPYIAVSLFVAVYYGRLYGFLTFGISLLFLMIPYFGGSFLSKGTELFSDNYRYIAITLAGVYIFGMIHKNFISVIENQRIFMRKVAKDKIRLEKEVKGLEVVNREFEERVLLQYDSITALYNQIKALNTQNLTKSLSIFLSTVQEFTWAEKISIWEYQKEANTLVMIANIGWTPEDAIYSIEDVNSSINGWVFRNNKFFSVRMLMESNTFSKMDTKRNILTFPINTSNSKWGVLNIESMPFPKFNLYTERILSILVDLAAPAIEHAVAYEEMIKHEDVDTHSGLPSPSQFMNLVEKEIQHSLERETGFSIVLMELPGFDEMITTYGEEKLYGLILKLLARINTLAGNKLDFFHYTNKNQFAFFYPGADYDGAAFLCFEILGMLTTHEWVIDGNSISLEAIFGYSSMGSTRITRDELLDSAEQLIEMQKV